MLCENAALSAAFFFAGQEPTLTRKEFVAFAEDHQGVPET